MDCSGVEVDGMRKGMLAAGVVFGLAILVTGGSAAAGTRLALEGGPSWLSGNELFEESTVYAGAGIGISLGGDVSPHASLAFLVRHATARNGKARFEDPQGYFTSELGFGRQVSTLCAALLSLHMRDVATTRGICPRLDAGLGMHYAMVDRLVRTDWEFDYTAYSSRTETLLKPAVLIGAGLDIPLAHTDGGYLLSVGVAWVQPLSSHPVLEETAMRVGVCRRWGT